MKILIFWFFSFRTRTSLVKVVSMVQKIEVLKKGLKFCKLHHEKKKKIFMEQRNGFFFVIFTMKLSSAALNYSNEHSTLNSARIFL